MPTTSNHEHPYPESVRVGPWHQHSHAHPRIDPHMRAIPIPTTATGTTQTTTLLVSGVRSGAPRSEARTREAEGAATRSVALTLIEPPIRQSAALAARQDCIRRTTAPAQQLDVLGHLHGSSDTPRWLSAGRGRPARTPFGFLVRALAMVVPATRCGVCCRSLVGPGIWWRVGGMGDLPVEALFPQGRGRCRGGRRRRRSRQVVDHHQPAGHSHLD